jgi:hypothetical protein
MFSYLIGMSTRPGSPLACAPPPTGLAAGGQARISDHCPIAVVFESNEPVEPADAMAVLLDRLVAVQTKLEDIRAGVAALRE